MSIFPQSPALRINHSSCRYCAAPAVPGTDFCPAHTGEAGRLLLYPDRAGYKDPDYRRARRVAIRRANGHCEACGDPLPVGANGRYILQTHHIDEDPTNNDPANLQVACDACHSGARKPAS